MNIFSEIDGKKGETLSSAVLRYLMLTSVDIRERIIDLFSAEASTGPIDCVSHFSCETEVATNDSTQTDNLSGFLDILISTDDAVIGIENKLYADFQEGQPYKYMELIQSRADKYKELYAKDYRAFIVILLPDTRKNKVEHEIKKKLSDWPNQSVSNYIFLSWENLLSNINRIEGLSPESTITIQQFSAYMDEQIGFYPKYLRNLPHFKRKFLGNGNAAQKELIAKLWRFFPQPGSRLSSSERHGYLGYYFFTSTEGISGWFGFVSDRNIPGAEVNTSTFIIALNKDIGELPKPLVRLDRLSDIWTHNRYAWKLTLTEEGKDPKFWVELVAPLHAYETP